MSTKRKTKEEFIQDCINIHGDKYDYEKVIYVNSKIKVILICKKHGEFSILPNSHISRRAGCQKCSISNRVEKSKTSYETFLEKAKKIHKSTYIYNDLSFKNLNDKMIITCKEHGNFEQKPIEHLSGKGCRKCYFKSNEKNINIFIESANKIYNNAFNYEKFNYINSKTPSIIICNNGHEFERSPNRHLSTNDKCILCLKSKKLELYVKKLSKVDGFSYTQKKGELFEFTCNTCSKQFNRKVSEHLKLINCIYCKPNKDNLSTFIKKSILIHDVKFDYSNVNYIDSKSKVNLICDKGHSFSQNANNHLNGVGCPNCNRFNVKENKLLEFIKEHYSGKIIQSDRTILSGKELDIYIPDLNLSFEFNGLYWHSELYKDKKYHMNKTDCCLKNDITLIHIWEDDWDNKTDIIKSIILNKLGKSERIFARKCHIKYVNCEDSRLFLNSNHIQGFVGSKIKLGLYYNDELVSLMTFGSLRKSLGQKSINNVYELLRFCNKKNTSVVGGASKLFKYFLSKFEVNSVVSYSDNSRGFGNLYKQLGFEFIHNSVPNYYYIIDGVRKHRFNFRKDKLISEGDDPNKTEVEIMSDRGIYRIFDCGSKKWSLKHK